MRISGSFDDDAALRSIVNDPELSSEERLAALALVASRIGKLRSSRGVTNNHIHTFYSFSPYSPSMAALRSREAGLEVAGSVDHDSIAAAREMTAACAVLGLGSVTGCELRVTMRELPDGSRLSFAGRKINNPDSPGLAYMTIQGLSASRIEELQSFLAPIRNARRERMRRMTEAASLVLSVAGIESLDFERDVLARSKAAEGGGVTERHLLAAVARKLIARFGTGARLLDGLERSLGIRASPKAAALISGSAGEELVYDVLGLLKTDFLDRVFEQPSGDECPDAASVVAFALSIGAVPAYAYLGDVVDSPTGDKRAEKFEDDFLEELFAALSELRFAAVAYMPPRNTSAQIERVRRLCVEYGLMQISGVDINSPRQIFDCPELVLPEFANLRDSAWALAAHERLSNIDPRAALFSDDNPLAQLSIEGRIEAYARAGRTLDPDRPDDAVTVLNDLFQGRFTR
jgi:hypothetical protein